MEGSGSGNSALHTGLEVAENPRMLAQVSVVRIIIMRICEGTNVSYATLSPELNILSARRCI